MKTNPGIKALVLIASLLLLIPISKSWYSFLARTIFYDELLKYKILTKSTAAVSECRFSEIENYSIPKKVHINGIDYTVTCIGNSAFKFCSSLKNIEIPESTKHNRTFYYCSHLTNIEFPATIKSIGNSAFKGCTSLNNIKIPAGVISIERGAFWGCSSLENIEIPENVTSISFSVFKNCSSLTNIEIPTNIFSIGFSAFENCSNLTSIEIPESVIFIGHSAFAGCNNLNVVIDNSKDSVKIEEDAFKECKSVRYTRLMVDD